MATRQQFNRLLRIEAVEAAVCDRVIVIEAKSRADVERQYAEIAERTGTPVSDRDRVIVIRRLTDAAELGPPLVDGRYLDGSLPQHAVGHRHPEEGSRRAPRVPSAPPVGDRLAFHGRTRSRRSKVKPEPWPWPRPVRRRGTHRSGDGGDGGVHGPCRDVARARASVQRHQARPLPRHPAADPSSGTSKR
jgi:hypothetical protein